MYRTTMRAHGLKPAEIALDAAWDLDTRTMLAAIDMMRPNLVFIASPNNPTGNSMSADRLDAVVEAARSAGAFPVVDEAYIEYARAAKSGTRKPRAPGTGVLRTLSKLGFAALRVGWLEADAELVRELGKARQPFNVSSTSQAAARAVLENVWDEVQEGVGRVISERERVASELAGMSGIDAVTPSDANFLWVRTARSAGDVYAGLVARGVLVRSFHATGGRLANQIRVTIGAPSENDAFLEAVRECS
jgi:histidinol-phosphate aminotransferase